MKNARQTAILTIVAEQVIQTQEELAAALGAVGFPVTQATVSRDIRELHLAKAMDADGVYRYAAPDRHTRTPDERFVRMLRDSVVSTACSECLVIVKTLPGMANAAGEALDSMDLPEMLGCIAGDNTLFLVSRSSAEAPALAARIREMAR